MFKILRATLAVLMLFLWKPGNSQQPVIVMEKFDYIWEPDHMGMSGPGTSSPGILRVILASDDSVKSAIKNSFVTAILERWNVTMADVTLKVKPLGIFSKTAKFKTQVKNKESGQWYLFLLINDKGKFSDYTDSLRPFYTSFELKCSLVNGSNDSLIFDRTLGVNIFEGSSPKDQVLLTRLPAYPAYFIKAFDSMARWLFQPGPNGNKSLTLKPACVFEEKAITETPIIQSVFSSSNDSIQHLTDPSFSLYPSEVKYEKTGVKRNIGSNLANGALALIPHFQTSKSKIIKYRADFPFKDVDSTYHCLINYFEKESSNIENVKNNDGSYSFQNSGYHNERGIDAASHHFVTLGTDTLSTFNIQYLNPDAARRSDKLMWDGTDSATIIKQPYEWGNADKETTVVLSGVMEGISFSMKTSKNLKIKEFYINEQLVAIIQGDNNPDKAFVYRSISNRQFKLFTILSALPYNHF